MKILDHVIDQELFNSLNSRVYRAHRDEDRLPVCLKVLNHAFPPPKKIAWFRREFEILSALSGIAGVVEATKLDRDGQCWFMVLEDFGGESLDRLSREKLLPMDLFLKLAAKLAHALGEVHERGVIHKDVNPSNIVMNPETGVVKLIDFGISTLIFQESQALRNPAVLEGTLAYMSPEQTGRTNRPVDFRTDLYSLGVTFWQLLTGSLPFPSEDPMELVHCHLAKPVTAPVNVNADIPSVLSDIVMKLLAKSAGERYQSAQSLATDLEACQLAWEAKGTIEPFEIGRGRHGLRFQMPQKLYGREEQKARLLESFDRVHQERVELMLVSGYSGIGKTSLVQEIYQPVTKRRGYFISGKFDQLQRDIPYASIIQALRSLLQQILTESEAEVAAWKVALESALGANAQVMVDVIPELELILGPQSAIVDLPPTEAMNRANLTLRNFIHVFAASAHPLVIFLDDLQWADPGSLRLIKSLILDPEAGHLLILGAYRDNEVTPAHRLMLALDELRKQGAIVNEIVLTPLSQNNVTEFLADTLSCEQERVQRLAELTLTKTDGNPFFMREFLQTLHTDGLIARTLDPQSEILWSWSLKDIETQEITHNVVELLAKKLRKLPERSQEELKLAACIGNHFDLQALATVAEQAPRETALALAPALVEGLVVALDNNYKVATLDVEGLADAINVTYKFAHDRIQQAAYSLIGEQERQAVHWRIGRRLFAVACAANEREDRVFDIVGHLNAGRVQATRREELDELAELNLLACRKALDSAAFAAANTYARAGLDALDTAPFEQQYRLALDLNEVAAESAFLSGDFKEMQRNIDVVVEQARDLLETVKVHEIKILAANAQEDPIAAVGTALDLFEKLGTSTHRSPRTPHVLYELLRTKMAIGRRSIDDLAAMPDMQDPMKLAVVTVGCSIYSSAYVASPFVFAANVLKQVRIVAQHGNCSVSPLVYAVYGVLLAGLVGDIRGSYKFGRLATRLLERPDARKIRAQAHVTIDGLTTHWAEHLKRCSRALHEAYLIGLETGELEYACYAAYVAAKYDYQRGVDLTSLADLMGKYAEAMQEHKQDIPRNCHLSWFQAVLNLTTPTENPTDLVGDAYDEHRMIPEHREVNDQMAMANAYTAKMTLCSIFGDFAKSLEVAEEGEGTMEAVMSQSDPVLFQFHASLARLAVCADPFHPRRRELLRKVASDQKKLKKIAAAAPMNYQAKYVLVEAERARLAGQRAEAQELYERAIDLAREHEFLSEEALAQESAGRFYLENGRNDPARHYLRDAHYSYDRWGATTKVEALEAEYPEFLARETSARELATKHTHTSATVASITSSTRATAGALDLGSVLKASQALSREVVLSELLKRMLAIVMENAGAQRGLLLLSCDGELRLEAEGTVDQDEVRLLPSLPLQPGEGERHRLPASVIKFVARTNEGIVLDDAFDDQRFAKDPYIAEVRPKSILCLPIVGQGKLKGIIYLENNHAAGAFTPERIEILDLLSGQMLVSMDNATLYETLEERVRERTEQLEVRNRFIRGTFGRYLSDEIVDNLLETKEGLDFGGENRTVTIMMTDLRGFSAMCESLPPEKVIALLNSYLSEMTLVILKYEGTIDEFIGDAVLVVFGAPLWRQDDAERAVACALEMQLRIAHVNESNVAAGLPEISMGIGINTGEVVVGNIGSDKRAKYGVVGRTINIASRIESFTVGGQVLIAESTREAIDSELTIDTSLEVEPKGAKQPITIHDVVGIGGRHNIELPRGIRTLEQFDVDLEVRYMVVTGKMVSGQEHSGRIIRIGGNEAEVRGAANMAPLTNLRLRLLDGSGIELAKDVYGKVLPRKEESDDCFVLSFTSIPASVRSMLQS